MTKPPKYTPNLLGEKGDFLSCVEMRSRPLFLKGQVGVGPPVRSSKVGEWERGHPMFQRAGERDLQDRSPRATEAKLRS